MGTWRLPDYRWSNTLPIRACRNLDAKIFPPFSPTQLPFLGSIDICSALSLHRASSLGWHTWPPLRQVLKLKGNNPLTQDADYHKISKWLNSVFWIITLSYHSYVASVIELEIDNSHNLTVWPALGSRAGPSIFQVELRSLLSVFDRWLNINNSWKLTPLTEYVSMSFIYNHNYEHSTYLAFLITRTGKNYMQHFCVNKNAKCKNLR